VNIYIYIYRHFRKQNAHRCSRRLIFQKCPTSSSKYTTNLVTGFYMNWETTGTNNCSQKSNKLPAQHCLQHQDHLACFKTCSAENFGTPQCVLFPGHVLVSSTCSIEAEKCRNPDPCWPHDSRTYCLNMVT
jgi:hypothetical protein